MGLARWMLIVVVWSLPWCCVAAQEAGTPPSLNVEGIKGKLVICGGGRLPDSILQRFVNLAGGSQARLVVIPTAGADRSLQDRERLLAPWRKYELASLGVLHTRSREEANRDEFVAPLKTATAVWLGGGQQSRISDAYLGTSVERELLALLERGGVVGGTSAGAAIQSRRMIAGGNPVPRLATGFDFLPDSVIDQHFSQRARKPRLLDAVAAGPPSFGIGIDEGTAIVVEGRRIEVLGDARVTICLPSSTTRAARDYELAAGASEDLTALRRAARARHGNEWPVDQPQTPSVPQGALLIAGGGRLPGDVLQRFIELAGGPDALIAILPTASEDRIPNGAAERRLFERAGARNLAVLAGRSRLEVESDDCRATLARAHGIWFGGGRQWRFVDAYAGTLAVESFRDVLRRGGVIGGSSAGASIQADYLVRGSPLGNTQVIAEGYERGFGFLPGTAIDQHFSQRKRHPDMAQLVRALPQFLGIGIDESTALLVHGSRAEVIGEHSAWFFDRSRPDDLDVPLRISAGEAFDFKLRQKVQSAGDE